MTDRRAALAASIANTILEFYPQPDGDIVVPSRDTQQALGSVLAMLLEAEPLFDTPAKLHEACSLLAAETLIQAEAMRQQFELTGRVHGMPRAPSSTNLLRLMAYQCRAAAFCVFGLIGIMRVADSIRDHRQPHSKDDWDATEISSSRVVARNPSQGQNQSFIISVANALARSPYCVATTIQRGGGRIGGNFPSMAVRARQSATCGSSQIG